MAFHLLGPFEARHEGQRVLVAGRRQERCLLAILLLEAGAVVTTDRLIDLQWDGGAPASARGTVHTCIGRLRAALAPYGLRLDTRHDGYAVEPDTHVVDAREFVHLVREAAAAGDSAQRVRLHDRASRSGAARCSPTWPAPGCASVSAARSTTCGSAPGCGSRSGPSPAAPPTCSPAPAGS